MYILIHNEGVEMEKIIKFIEICVILVIASMCINNTLRTLSTTTPPPTELVERITAKEAFYLAEELVKSEYEDAHLNTVGAGTTSFVARLTSFPVDGKSFKWRFVFISPTAQKRIEISVEDGVATIDKVWEWTPDEEDHWKEWIIDPDEWNIDSPEAEQVADRHGGAEYKEDDPDHCVRQMTLHATKNELLWLIDYGPLKGKSGKLQGVGMKIDAKTGEFLRKSETTYG